jgi:hypothetical protein
MRERVGADLRHISRRIIRRCIRRGGRGLSQSNWLRLCNRIRLVLDSLLNVASMIRKKDDVLERRRAEHWRSTIEVVIRLHW